MGDEGKVYVGNISYHTSVETLQQTFEEYGPVDDVVIVTDRDTGRSRGFGFVTFRDSNDADAAINGLHQTSIDGRDITVNKANQRRSGGGGGSRGRGYNRGGGGGGW